MSRTLSIAALLAMIGSTLTGSVEASAATYQLDRTIRDSRIVESSGLARSTYARAALWTHNDSGDSARIFAIGWDGSTKATLNLSGAGAADYEDIASGPGNSLWVGDIGDNPWRRSRISVYKVTEPKTLAGAATVAATRYNFQFPDGPRDAEALMVNPVSGRLFVVSKVTPDGAAIYRAPATLSTTTTNALTKVANAPPSVTGGSFKPDGTGFVLTDYSSVYVYPSLGSTPVKIAKPALRQGESVEVSRDGTTIFVGSEGSSSPVYALPMPATSTSSTVTVVPERASWAHRYKAVEPTGDWNLNSYDDASWQRGGAPIGFGSTSVVTNVDIQPTTDRPRTAYFRTAFNLANAGSIHELRLTTRADDGLAVYVNGTEVVRSNLAQGADHMTYAHTAVSTSTALSNRVVVSVPGSLLKEGYNTITADVHLNYRATADMTFDLGAVASVKSGAPTPTVSRGSYQAPDTTPSAPTDLPGWKLDYADGFSGIDSTKWTLYDQEAWSRDLAYVLARNVSTANGVLRLQAKKESAGGRAYTSGDMTTAGKYSLPNYFRVEVRAKVPLQAGMWAAPIWLRPAGGGAGEIDLVETYGVERLNPMVHQTIHTDYGPTHQQTHYMNAFTRFPGSATGWHTYVVEKTPGQMVMWVDGIKTATFNASTSSWYNTYYEAGKRWHLRASLQVGGGDNVPDHTTDWSGDNTAMQIDHVYTWVAQ